MTVNMTDEALSGFQGSGEETAFILRDGGRITGKVVDFDGYVVIVSGTPDRLIYRHSILKLISAKALNQVKAQRAEEKKRGGEAGPKKPSQKPRRKQPGREATVPVQKPAEPGFSNPMADAMQKWLKSQNGGG